MSLRACIPGMVERGEIDQAKADEMGLLFDDLHQDFRRQFGDQAADAMASDATLKAMDAELVRKKRLAMGSARARSDMVKKMGDFAGGGDGPIPPRAAEAFFDKTPGASYSNVEGRRRAIVARSHAMMDGILARFHAGVTGVVAHKADLADMVRELFGEDSGSVAAKQLAGAWIDASEMLRRRFNAAGGDIGKLDKWGLPQSHDTLRVRKTGYEAWREFILPKLDRDAMTDRRTNLPFSDASLEVALRDVFETIRTDGWNDHTPGSGGGKGALANQRSDPRFLQFKSADDWMDYADQFGAGSAYDAMTGHVRGMARDIALMEVLGPNPNASVAWLKDTIQQSAALDSAPGSKAVDAAYAATKQIDRLYGEITGAAGRPESRTIALTFSTIRSVQTAAKLGSAFVSAVPTDPMFGVMARKINGLPAARMIGDYVKLFGPGLEDKQLAIRQGMIAEEWSQRTAGQSRALGEELSGEIAGRLAEGVLRVSGLQRITQAGRWAFGMEFVSHLTNQSVKPWGALDAAYRRMWERYGVNEAGWNSIRSTALEVDRGTPWLKPVNIEDRELGDKVLEAIHGEMYYAVPETDLRTRALYNSVAPKGTFAGEMIRSGLLFKGFGITTMLMQSRRIMEIGNRSLWSAAGYAGSLAILTTLGGAMALQMKALVGGKDPRPMDDPKFWGAATLQGGGWGIFGDFLQSQDNRFGGGFAGTLAGPLAGDVQSIADIAKAKSPAWAAARTARQFLPGGSLWYARLAFDRNVTDQVQEAIDPNYRQAWARMEKRAQDQRTQMWWQPGERTPDRAPDFNNVMGGDQPP